MNWAWLPNAITVLRIVLVIPTAWLLWQGEYVSALVLMSIAGASDALDGWLARRFHWLSRLGAALDPIADKLLVAVMFVVFTAQEHIPLWLTGIVLGRDIIILVGAIVYRLLFGPFEFAPSLVSKANTALQIFTVLFVLFVLCDFGRLSELLEQILDPYGFWLLAVLGLVSGAHYVLTWGAKALRQRAAQRSG